MVGPNYHSIPDPYEVVTYKKDNIPPMNTSLWYVHKWLDEFQDKFRAVLEYVWFVRCPWDNKVFAEFKYTVEKYHQSVGEWLPFL